MELDDSVISVQEEVREALERGDPVVALESTIIAHGMPFPENLRTARKLEDVVRSSGALPATVAILNGTLKIGLSDPELFLIAKQGPAIAKVSRRDIARIVSEGGNGATTVSATMVACAIAGIRVFATGGIGGVHRGAESSFDESADLVEMSRSSVCVVCSGVKSILDIPKTLERLETLGVNVMTLNSQEFPAFYTRESGLPSPYNVQSETEIAQMLLAADKMALQSGTLVAVPVPAEFAANASRVGAAIASALAQAEREGVTGAAITPFVLSKIVELTNGEALETNQRLVENNAAIAAKIAVEYSTASQGFSNKPSKGVGSGQGVLVVGATILDIYSRPDDSRAGVILRTSNPGKVRTSYGGVARNVAVTLSGLNRPPVSLITAVGDDITGNEAISDLKKAGLSPGMVLRRKGFRTATYVAMHGQDGDLNVAVVDTSIYDSAPFLEILQKGRTFDNIKFVVVDANIHVDEMKVIADRCKEEKLELFYEPTSVPKSTKIVKAGALDAVSWMFPSELEVVEMAIAAAGRRVRTPQEGAEVLLSSGVGRVVVTQGSRGATLFRKNMEIFHVPAQEVKSVANTAGAGDVLAAVVIHAISAGESEEEALRMAVGVASQSIQGHEAVPKQLLPKL